MKVLVAEDNEASRNLLVKMLHVYGHEVTATANGAEALEQALKEPPDILVSDILMPKMDGYQLCHEWRQNEKLRDIPFVFYTATYTSDEDEKFALSLGANTFIRKPTEPDAFIQILEEVFEKAKTGLLAPPEAIPTELSLYLTEYNKRIVAQLDKKVAQLETEITERKRAEEQLEHSFVDLAETVSRAMASRDPYTAGHQRRVAGLARLVGEKMGLDKNRLIGIYIAGLLHDIGKISIPESILSKPGKLTEEEWNLIRVHARQGYAILKDAGLPWPVADRALHHHERMDGSGYPDGVSGNELSLENRILGVCDVVEAMSSFRPYRPARSLTEILRELRTGRGTKYDPDMTDIMLEIIETGEFDLGGEAK